MTEDMAKQRIDHESIQDQNGSRDAARIGRRAKHKLFANQSAAEKEQALQHKQRAEYIGGFVDAAEEDQMIDDAHPKPEHRKDDADDIVGESCSPHG